jgi:excisionase family DNA binding protein
MTARHPAGDLPPDDQLWTVPDVAKFLRASTSWVYKAAERDQLPSIRIGTMLRFNPAEVRDWLDARKRGTAALTVAANESVTSRSPNGSEG